MPALLAAGIFLAGTSLMPPLFWLFGLLAVGAFHGLKANANRASEVQRFYATYSQAQSDFIRARADWDKWAGEETFLQAYNKFEQLRSALQSLPQRRQRALEQLRQNHRKLQMDRFLDRFRIEHAQIKKIGPGRKQTLASYGIETAEDLVSSRIQVVPGFGPGLEANLLNWRRSLEVKFVFNPALPIDPQDINRVETEILTQRNKTFAAVKQAHAEAVQAHSRIVASRRSMFPKLQRIHQSYEQARVDYEHVK